MYAYLREHPMLSAPNSKELHFFDNEEIDWNYPNYEVLHKCFPDRDDERSRFEITPIYSYWKPSLLRIRRYNRDAKLIFLFRDPADRALSHWKMEVSRSAETLSFGEAVRIGRRRLLDCSATARDRRVYSYVERGFYSGQVGRALALFPRDQLLFLDSAKLFSNHVTTLEQITQFLGISSFGLVPVKHENAGSNLDLPNQLDHTDLRFIASLMRHDLEVFSELSGLDISDWATVRLCGSGYTS